MATNNFHRQKGLGLIELMAAMAVLAILLAFAIPAFQDLRTRLIFSAALESIRADLQLAKNTAVTRNQHVYVSFVNGNNWCYVVTTDRTCSCTDDCTDSSAVLRTARSFEYPGVLISGDAESGSAFAGNQCGGTECVRFDRVRGTALGSNGTVRLKADQFEAQVVVSGLGRIRTCSNSSNFSGAPPC